MAALPVTHRIAYADTRATNPTYRIHQPTVPNRFRIYARDIGETHAGLEFCRGGRVLFECGAPSSAR